MEKSACSEPAPTSASACSKCGKITNSAAVSGRISSTE
jgi:hypothetical protein